MLHLRNKITLFLSVIVIGLASSSCIKKINLYQEDPGRKQVIVPEPDFVYPFGQETQNKTIEITIHTKADKSLSEITTAEIPTLKYNKDWLFMLTQDDCKPTIFCRTWAAINGKAVSYGYTYDLTHLQVGDLPPDYLYLNKTLGSTDGAGREVRFSFTATLSPEWSYMNDATTIFKSNQKDVGRFKGQKGLLWGSVKEMLNYGVGISFHDLLVTNEDKTVSSLIEHFEIAQDIIQNKLQGRKCKMLAEPGGDKMYTEAATKYESLSTITAQSAALKLYPFLTRDDLYKVAIERGFYGENPKTVEDEIKKLNQPYSSWPAIYLGVHNTDAGWINLLEWLNDTYGKDGDDSMWMPSHEEFYEYNYYRNHCRPTVSKPDAHTLKITVTLTGDGKGNFYYPAITLNVDGLYLKDIERIESNNDVTGLSYADRKNGNGIMLNIDCRKFLANHAENFVIRYEKDPTNHSNKADARYFVSMLKDSDTKTNLLKRIK